MLSKNYSSIKCSVNFLQRSSTYANVLARKSSAWTQDKTVKSPFKGIEIPKCTLYDYVWQNLDKWPERTVSVCATTGRGYTYEQAFSLSNTFAASLRTKFKIQDGDFVAVMLPNIPDYPLVAMGILEAGAVITTINPVYTSYEVQRQLSMSKPKLIVTLPETVNVIRQAITHAKLDLKIIVVKTNGNPAPEGTISFNELIEDPHVDKSCLKKVRRNVKDLCFLPYSSGTTGMPKGVELTNRNLIANCEQMNEPVISVHSETTAKHQDSVMTVLPYFHIYGALVIMFHTMSLGIKMVTLDKFTPQAFLQGLEKHKTNVLFAAPPLILLLTDMGSKKSLQYLETIINGSAPLAKSDADKFFGKAGRDLDFRQGYGLTETSPVVTMSSRGSKEYGSVGQALPDTELRITGDNQKPLGPGEKGELLIRGPQVMKGYRDNPQANSEALTPDGWFRSGDLAVIDDDGIVTIADRLKELIKVKGFQVPPAELEGVLREHDAVLDAAVVGVPCPKSGEAPRAFVVLKKDVKANLEDISKFVEERVAPFKRLRDVIFVDSIPKNSAGKILRRELKEKFSSQPRNVPTRKKYESPTRFNPSPNQPVMMYTTAPKYRKTKIKMDRGKKNPPINV